MTTYYLDISVVSAGEYQAYAATPTWGGNATDKPLPMDGNGLGQSGASAVVAVAEIDVSSASVAATNTLVVAGATLTAVASGAAANQFNVASGATLASNLVASINAATNTVNAGSCQALLGLQYWCFARVKPGASTVVQIATRIAGANFNYASNSNVGITTAGWSVAPTITQFAGGADGPFAYFIATSAIFGKALWGWGIFPIKAGGPTDPGTTSDVVITRTKRSAANLTLTMALAGNTTIYATAGRVFVFDDGTTWSGDNGVLTMAVSASNAWTFQFGSGVTAPLRFIARAKYGFKVTWQGYTTSYPGFLGYGGGGTVISWERCEIEAVTAGSVLYLAINAANMAIVWLNCRMTFRAATALYPTHDSNCYGARYIHIGNDVNFVGRGASVGGLQYSSGGFAQQHGIVVWAHNRFTVDGGVYSVTGIVTASGWPPYLHVRAENNVGVQNAATGLGGASGPWAGSMVWDDAAGVRNFRAEHPNYVIDWQAGVNIPTYNSTLPDGTPFAHRVTWEPARLVDSYPTNIARYATFYKDTAGVKTLALELLVPTAEIPKRAQVFITVKYQGNDDVLYTEHSAESWDVMALGTGADLADGVGTGAWSLNGVTGVSSKKLALTTANAVKQNTEVVADLWFRGGPSANRLIYINPDLQVS